MLGEMLSIGNRQAKAQFVNVARHLSPSPSAKESKYPAQYSTNATLGNLIGTSDRLKKCETFQAFDSTQSEPAIDFKNASAQGTNC
jgi:hypothetical protein